MKATLPRRCMLLAGLSLIPGARVLARAPGAASSSAILPDVNAKFGEDGRVRPWRGDTIVTPLETTSPAYPAMTAVNAQLLNDYRGWVAATPPSSYHMTIFGGADAERRTHRWWPRDLPLDASFDMADRMIRARLDAHVFNYPVPIRMVVDLSKDIPDTPTIFLRPADNAERDVLYRLRRDIADVIDIHPPDVESFRFHMTVGYVFKLMPPDVAARFRRSLRGWREEVARAAPVIDFPVPSYCVFDNMFAFRPVSRLQRPR